MHDHYIDGTRTNVLLLDIQHKNVVKGITDMYRGDRAHYAYLKMSS